EGYVQRNRSLHRDRLQCKGAAGAPDQDVGADAEADTDVATGAYVFPGESACGRTRGGREHGPAEHTTGADPDIEPHRIERTLIGRRGELILGESAFHCLVPGNDEADAWIKPAAQHADLRP